MGWKKSVGEAVLKQANQHTLRTGVMVAGSPLVALGAVKSTMLGWDLMFSDDSAAAQTVDSVKEKVKKEGLLGAGKELAVGEDHNDQSIIGRGTDLMLGDGTADKAHDMVSGVYNTGKRIFGGSGSSDVADMQGEMMVREGGGLSDWFGSLGGGLGDILSNLTSGKGLGMLAMIPAAFLLFGGKGWMSKIAGLFLGLFAFKTMLQPQRQLALPSQQQLSQSYNMNNQRLLDGGRDVDNGRPAQEEESQHVVRRSRGL